ncbi:MAG TPA: STAS domain-containing protein [Candidatus Sulfotelmatobacter sp.]|jgi:anti-anti-sigma factor|nr:STAS domain-containing protein [Candidatus Sulfotelmatobacter sp.]
MKMLVETTLSGIAEIHLAGDLDAKGTGDIEVQFAAVTGEKSKVLLNLSQVGFLASIGIRSILSASKVLNRRGGRLVLFDPCEAVEQVLKTCGVNGVVMITHDRAEAETALA